MGRRAPRPAARSPYHAIAGLLHHGSGPRYTDLLKPDFPQGLAHHAARVAARYPWLRMFTPVNEPLTTARFAGLYGHWYPHGRDYPAFLRALVNQCMGVLLSMRAIRRVTPSALLVQTEDLGKVFSPPELRYQAEHENQRRWLGFDLLCGHVDRSHPWHRLLRDAGIRERELDLFLGGEGKPGIVGINHYPTSERYLDPDLHAYPKASRGGNGRDAYADVEAVRMDLPQSDIGIEARLVEASERYHLPLAVTETHLGCTREEQMRWLAEIWRVARKLKGRGIDMRAVTVWSLFGAFDWNSLLTRKAGFYEPGAFDIRSDPPRPTALARIAASLAQTGGCDHVVLDRPGWWRRRDRFYRPKPSPTAPKHRRQVLLTGGGTLGRSLEQICHLRGLAAVLHDCRGLGPEGEASVQAAIERVKPWAVVDAGDRGQPAHAVRTAETLARCCSRSGIPLVIFSSDHVFDGAAEQPYVESDPVTANDASGQGMAEAERRAIDLNRQTLVIRSGQVLGTGDGRSFLSETLRGLAAGRRVALSDAASVSPVYLPDLLHAALDLLLDGEEGLWHLTGEGADSPFEFARRAARIAAIDCAGLTRCSGSEMRALSSERAILLPALASGVERWARDCAPLWRDSPHTYLPATNG